MGAGDYRIGIEGKFYYGSAGSQAATEADNVDGVELALTKTMANAARRGKSWKANKPVVSEASLSWTMWDIEADSFLTDIKNAYLNNTAIALWPTDAASGEGLDADFYISELRRSEDNEGFITYNVTALPTDENRDPVWS